MEGQQLRHLCGDYFMEVFHLEFNVHHVVSLHKILSLFLWTLSSIKEIVILLQKSHSCFSNTPWKGLTAFSFESLISFGDRIQGPLSLQTEDKPRVD